MTKQVTIPIFVPHLGCPFDCVFCNQKRITGKTTDITKNEVISTIEEYLGYLNRDRYIEVGFFGGSFTAIDPKVQDELLSIAYKYKKSGKIDGIRMSTRPDFIDEEVIARLKKYSVDVVELGVQSLDNEVLEASGRGHDDSIVYKSSKMLKSAGIGLGLQMMVGLPSDNFQKGLKTVEEFIKLDPECVRIYPTLVVKDTFLESQYLKNNYIPLDLHTSIDQVSEYLMMFELNNINVIRLGLQATDNIQLGRDVVAGPFHPSYGQLVESNIFKKIIDFNLEQLEIANSRQLIIRANPKSISSIVGQRGTNRDYLKEKYNFKIIKYIPDKNFTGKDLSLDIGGDSIFIDYRRQLRLYLYRNS